MITFTTHSPLTPSLYDGLSNNNGLYIPTVSTNRGGVIIN